MALKKGLPLTARGLEEQAEQTGIDLPTVWAILKVETAGCGFLRDRRPAILFERHIFRKETGGRFDAVAPDLSAAKWGGWGAGGANQHLRLQRAIKLDRRAALRSASWGIGQVMGFNAQRAGYDDVEAMVAAMESSEDEQLSAMFTFIRSRNLKTALKNRNWTVFARTYNGPKFAENGYHTKLAAAYQRYVTRGVPDVDARAAQLKLLYRGFDPRGIDGEFGSDSRAALRRFQVSVGLPETAQLDAATLKALN